MAAAMLSDRSKIDKVQAGLQVVNDWHVDLTNDTFDLDGTLNLDDFTAMDYPGYDQFVWTPGVPGIDGDSKAAVLPASASFQGPTSGGDVTVRMFTVSYLSPITSQRELLMSGELPGAPIVLTGPSDVVTINLQHLEYDENNHG